MNVVAIIQARMNSTRLPGKIMLPLAGRPLIEQLYNRVKRATKVDRVIVAIPKGTWNDMRDAVIPFNDFFLFDGDENDLVARYLACAIRHQADLIVRVPGDNPCVEPEYIDAIIEAYWAWPQVFATNTIVQVGDKLIDGLGAEVMSLSRLKWLERVTRGNALYREHPHMLFSDQKQWIWSEVLQSIRLDVNDQADYEFIKDIYDHIWPSNHNFTISDILAYLERKSVRAVMMYDGPITVQEG